MGSSRGAASGGSDFVISENCSDFRELSAGCTVFLKHTFFFFSQGLVTLVTVTGGGGVEAG